MAKDRNSRAFTILGEVNVNPQLGFVSEGKITALRELKKSEYGAYKKAASRLMTFSSDQHLFTIAGLNFDDYKSLLTRYFEEYSANPAMSWTRMEQMVLNVNRHILNFLSSVRTFLDHSETNLKRRYGPDSERLKFQDACSNAFDSSFSYRFLYRLRNYVQHCGMPLGALSLHSKESPPFSKKVYHSLAIEFTRDELLSKYDNWGSRIAEELRKLPERFEITPHITEMMKNLESINLTLIGDDLPELIQGAEEIQRLITPMKDMPVIPCIVWIKDVAAGGEELGLEIEWMPLHIVSFVMNLTKGKLTQSG